MLLRRTDVLLESCQIICGNGISLVREIWQEGDSGRPPFIHPPSVVVHWKEFDNPLRSGTIWHRNLFVHIFLSLVASIEPKAKVFLMTCC